MQRNPLTGLSREGVKKIKEKHSTTERNDDERNADDDCTSGKVQNDGTLHPRGNKKGRRHSVQATEDVDGHVSPKTNAAAHAAKRATPRVLDHSLVQSTTDIRDEKNVEEDDDEDELITVRSPQKPSPRYRAERNRELIGKR